MSANAYLISRIDRSMTNQTPTAEQIARIEALRASAKAFAYDIASECTDGREQMLALTHAEDALMWAVKAIVLG